jgi:Flp pilus assembly protein TadG
MRALLRGVRRLFRCDLGAELVEMGLVFPLLLLVVLGILDFGILFHRYEVLTNAAREGARLATLPNYCPNDTDCQTNVEDRVEAYMDAGLFVGTGTPTVTVGSAVPVTLGGNCMYTRTVTVSYPHDFGYVSGVIRYFGGNMAPRTITASSTMRTEVPVGSCP